MPDFAAARRNMVDTQLRTYDVTSHRLLDAVEATARESFVPEHLRDLAYTDQPIIVTAGGASRQLLAPMVLARLLQALDVKPGDKVLDCAGGSGYGAAIAAGLGATVTALEESADMAEHMRQCLAAAGVAGIAVQSGDLEAGAPLAAPFDVIVVHGAAEAEPLGLAAQLADGGRLGIILGHGRAGRAIVMTRNGGVFGRRTVFDAAAPDLRAFALKREFAF